MVFASHIGANLIGEYPEEQLLQDSVQSRDWGFIDSDTQYLTHNLHRYSGKFIPQIARQAIELTSRKGDVVLDPYAGSGTTLLEATLVGRRSIGVDLNPLAVLITSAKITPIPQSNLKTVRQFFQGLVQHLSELNRASLIPPDPHFQLLVDQARQDQRLQHAWYRKWFQEHVLFELVVLHRAIMQLNDIPCQNLALVAFSDILRRSSNAHTGYPNVMFDKNAGKRALPAGLFLRSFQECAEMVSRLDPRPFLEMKPEVVHGDAASLPIPTNSVDAVVTHPPYIGSIPYAEYGALSLGWLGYDSKDLDNRLTGGRRQAKDVVSRFRAGYSAMFSEATRVLRSGGRMFVMVGNPVVKAEVIDLGAITRELAAHAGLTLVAETTRAGINRRANKMGQEELLFFAKG